MSCPCKNCLDRTPGCHGSCSNYLEFKKNCETINNEKRKEYTRITSNYSSDYLKVMITRSQGDRKRGRNGNE